MQREHVGAFWQRLPHGCAIRKHHRNGAVQSLRAVVQIATLDRKSHRLPELRSHNSSELFLRLNQQEMIRRLQFQPLPQTGAHGTKRSAEFAGRAKQASNQLIERERRRGNQVRLALPDIDAAAVAKLNPPLPFELAVASTDCIGMKTESTRQFSRARQALPRREVVAEDPENDLCYELFADGNFAAAGKPELHDGLSYRRSLGANHRGHRGTR